mmetsp:Transcript_19208/g.17028  ORF Transcript_19208/g.17028 Transcript_19208/m.17028 type:complete len:172 (+) Transcript_19208:266-781(+)
MIRGLLIMVTQTTSLPKITRLAKHRIQLLSLALLLLKKTKQGSQTFKVDSPSKKSCSFANSGTLNKVVNLQPVEEEDKNESSDQDFSIEFDRRRHQPFGDDYRSSFKKSSYKMTSVKKINLPSPEDISEERLHEGPIIRNSVYNFNNKNSKEIFDRITRRSNIKTSLNRAI